MVTNNLEVKPANSAVGSPGTVVEQRSGTIIEPVPDRPVLDNTRTVAPVRTPGSDLDRTTDRNLLPTDRYNQTTTIPDRTVAPLDTRTVPQNVAPLDVRPAPQNLHIDAAKGHATLRGSVNSEAERQDIERRIRDLPGIQSVENQLEVKNPSTR